MKEEPGSTSRKREEGRQNVVIHEGADADPRYDGNEKADDRVDIVQPDESPAPRAETEEERK